MSASARFPEPVSDRSGASLGRWKACPSRQRTRPEEWFYGRVSWEDCIAAPRQLAVFRD